MPQSLHLRTRDAPDVARTTSRSVVPETLSAAAGRDMMTATTDGAQPRAWAARAAEENAGAGERHVMVGDRHLMVLAGSPWFA
jgi:hypothetical protein